MLRVEYHTAVKMSKVELYVFMQQILSYIKGGKKQVKNSVYTGLPYV